MRVRPVRGIGHLVACSLMMLLCAALFLPSIALAEGGSYSLTWTAADPTSYQKVTPGQLAPPATGRASDPLPNAIFGDPQESVTSLAPQDMALGQIVPFEMLITVDGTTAPEDGTIAFTALFATKTTSGGDFGYDPVYGVYAAFVDTDDSATVGGATATVDDITWSIINPGTANEAISGTIQVAGLADGDEVVVEVWVVLKSTIPAGTTGNVQTSIASAQTVVTSPDEPETINVGAQTVPLLRVQEFMTVEADLSVTKTDAPDPVVAGQQLTYTIVVTNNSTTTVANGIVVTDTLDANTTFVSASGAPYQVVGNTVTFTVGSLPPNSGGQTNTINLQIVVTVSATAPNNDTSTNPEPGSATPPTPPVDIVNRVTVSATTADPDTTDNTYYQPTNVLPLKHIIVYKFYDCNCNGRWDQGEPPLADWTIKLYDSTGQQLLDTQQTDANGKVDFMVPSGATYLVKEVLQTGWINTRELQYTVSVVDTEEPGTIYFGNKRLQKQCITVYKFNDCDGDGCWDSGEPPLANWTIKLFDESGALLETKLTDCNGKVVFEVWPGWYKVKEVLQTGWINTTPTEDSGDVTPGFNPVVYFGNKQQVTTQVITSYLFRDTDRDRCWDSGEPALANWSVQLYNSSGALICTKQTDSNGKVCFEVVPGWYRVKEVLQSGWINTTLVQDSGDVAAGSNPPTLYFGNVPVQKQVITSYAFRDSNRNGRWDSGEQPLANWSVQLYNSSGVLLCTKQTDSNGKVCFEVVPGCWYKVKEVLPSGWINTTPIQDSGDVPAGCNPTVYFGNIGGAPA